ncbi:MULTISPECIES: gamma-glutamyltransferase family protein [unclassified Leucobacter]|uniref:gamma-glutamyltransferase family protein n=1 Tax=unclassified Leucobacter TaxID=2621730 RepID=UPI00165D4406|nr:MULTISPECIES: gamma-glutamyltransferase [unclassified Leucobacter]MBC9935829.1 gamma-glutamyltransferase [Leucobacter sp. cx-87]
MTQNASLPHRGAVATPHASATEVGAAVLRAGGNAIDAAVAAAAALCVVYPNNVALGSDLVALVQTPSGEVIEMNATGGAPLGRDLDGMRSRHGDALPMYGADTINVPGAVRGWELMLMLGGSRSWSELLQPAIGLARDGVPMPSSVAKGIRSLEDLLLADPGCAEVFFRDGQPIAEGELFQQPALANTLELLANTGPDEFYRGELASRWLSALQERGSALTTRDLESFAPRTGPSLSVQLGELTVHSSRPNTQGFALLRALREAMTAGAHGIDPLALALAFTRTNAIRDQYLADPQFGGASGEELLEVPVPERVDSQFKGRPMGDTIGIAVSSADGYAVSLIQSVYFQFGAAVLDPSTGILFQNRGTSFSLSPKAANAYAPGKRPSHTLMPVLIHDGGTLRYVSSTMGGQGQPQIHAQLLAAGLAGDSPAEAVARPRWLVGRQAPADTPATVTVEGDVDDALITRFLEAGLEPKSVPQWSDSVGHANLIEIRASGEVLAASDPRSDGSATVV